MGSSIDFYLYFGVDNILKVEQLTSKGLVIIKSPKSKIVDSGNNNFIITRKSADHTVELDTLSIFIKYNEKIEYKGSIRLQWVNLPPPFAYFAGLRGGEISKSKVLAQKYLLASYFEYSKFFKFNIAPIITEFSIIIIDNSMIREIECTSNEIPEEQKQALENLKDNDILVFDNINVILPNNVKYKISPLVFRIKEN